MLSAEKGTYRVPEGQNQATDGIGGRLTHGCRACILFQTNEALKLGASVDEILETCAVAISIGGTMAAGETIRAIQFLGEKGLV